MNSHSPVNGEWFPNASNSPPPFAFGPNYNNPTIMKAKENASFGLFVFDDKTMERYIPHCSCKDLKSIQNKGGMLDANTANVIAFGMKEWATEKGATCFTHWFHPLTDTTARKYDSFTHLRGKVGYNQSGTPITQFTGRQLIQGEPDGSSFPTGGLRATSKARGYTAWDCTSPAFVITDEFGGCLYIPATFTSMFGLALDARTPLLKSERILSSAGVRALKLLHRNSPSEVPSDIFITVGTEQEMFIIEKEKFNKRPDLMKTGRTLFGHRPSLCQSSARPHYWGIIPTPVRSALDNARIRLETLGVPVATIHNEVAPCQFEIAPSFERASVCSDHNMLMMEVLQEECEKRNLSLLLHEKPFSYVNGSGKHANWSLATSKGENLFVPGDDPHSNHRFLFFFAAFLRGVSLRGDVLRAHTAVAGNAQRLGAMEAPPAIISVFIGEQLQQVVDDITHQNEPSRTDKTPLLDLGVVSLPKLFQDCSDRNRTSPLAFVGNRFEFRAVGSSQNPSLPVTAMNAVMAESIHAMCDQIEAFIEKETNEMREREGAGFFLSTEDETSLTMKAFDHVILETIKEHSRIIYNDDCYEQKYIEEMKARNVPNLSTTFSALETLKSDKAISLFGSTGVLSDIEVKSRGLAWASRVCEIRIVEGRVFVEMISKSILPACIAFQNYLSDALEKTTRLLGTNEDSEQKKILRNVHENTELMLKKKNELEAVLALVETKKSEDIWECLRLCEDLLEKMSQLRKPVDELEVLIGKDHWPFPTYEDIFVF